MSNWKFLKINVAGLVFNLADYVEFFTRDVKSLFTNNDMVEILYLDVFEDEKAKIHNFHATVLCCFAKHREPTENSHKTKQNNLFH